ncbi:hypothetical protein AUR64_15520 [Haloprofundus marisrubri]|uniref:CARDB domain-containing protein n=2 Tax=Haloprofundus marisrubri TaxID=1514971 RepID=A0A0W1R7L0_9EURY|nr:hypothetical protein AUR64_15520 [Haloprofundus marisrubri]
MGGAATTAQENVTFTDVSVSELQVDGGTVENVTVERLVVQEVEIGDQGTVEQGVFEDVSFDSIEVSGVSVEDIEVQDDDVNEASARGYLNSSESVSQVVIGTLRVDTLSVDEVNVEEDQTGLLSGDSMSNESESTEGESDSMGDSNESDSMADEGDSMGDSNGTMVLVREVNVDEMEVDSLTIQTLQQSTPMPSAFDDTEGMANYSLGENTNSTLQAIDQAEMAIDANREQFTDEQYVQLKTELANVRAAVEDGEVTEEESQELTDSTEEIRSTLDDSNVSDEQVQGAVDQLPDEARQVGSGNGDMVVIDAVDVGTVEVEEMTTGTTSVRVAAEWDSLAVTNVQGPSEVSPDEGYNVTVTVVNPTDETVADTVSYRLGLSSSASELVVVEPGETQTVTLEFNGVSESTLERSGEPQHIVTTSKTQVTLPVSVTNSSSNSTSS